jgi:hypothetical protein
VHCIAMSQLVWVEQMSSRGLPFHPEDKYI